MITNRKTGLLAFLAIVLILALSACSQPDGSGASTAKVRVTGTAAQSSAKQRAVSDAVVFASGTVSLEGEDITSQLKPVQTGTAGGSNDVAFEADIPVASDVVSYSVSPRTGFVFDEWKITRDSRKELKNDYRDSWWDVLVEIQNIIKDDSQTIHINPEYIEYIRPTFDRGYYLDIDINASEDGDGSADNPFTSLDALIKTLTTDSISRYDDDELTIKIRKGDVSGSFDLSGLSTYYTDDIELKLIGGYDNDWNLSQNKTVISSITFPSLSGNSIEELEIELRNIELTELDYDKLPKSGDDFEIDFRNCSVRTLKNASGKIVNGLVVVDKLENSSNAIFVNSSAPYDANSSYYHSIVRDAGTNDIKGQNNIVLGTAPAGVSGTENLYLDVSWAEGSYKTDNQTLITQITTAVPLSEDFKLPVTSSRDDDDFEADDLLEEDIEGRERYLSDDDYDDDDRSSREPWYRNIRVSYGPYEYQYFDD